MGEATTNYSLKYQARVLVALPSDTISSKWLVGTTALREENEVRMLQYDADNEQLVCKLAYSHPAEVWDIAPCPTRDDVFVSVWAKAGNSSATLWRVVDGESSSAGQPAAAAGRSPELQLEQQAELAGQSRAMRCALWSSQQTDTVVTLEEGFLKKWSITGAGAECTSSCPAGEMVQLWSGALHPRNASLLCTAGSNDVQTWDLRNLGRPIGEIKMAHKMPVRSISFAPHNDTRVLTAGDDCKLRFWDLRNPGQALLELGGHRHWVWRAAYNPVNDSLIASCSSDCCVNLYYTPNLAALPGHVCMGAFHHRDEHARRGIASWPGSRRSHLLSGDLDGKVASWDEHEDSVYGMAWSAADPWLLASLSFDGRVTIDRVPKNIKYKILI
ncbi:hypothetical protein VOLCADRAFT_81755 [Volvox carteri f. nagariensis]|uniref:EIPR1-like beta-propeller domain-containing protein n=1 Tax=Volvox carteri f. nagariensis TaxID=3068 RepID=D8U0X7_VOLCA|nr:uncharacterized protein VOLCADRAFT_81755 [Volvox carteri f. nagariensis]EFJ46715.1 hypothetical protein VOLCADRAFT_81755 [Volvox carteri f. nagariensis]|eukprot:XP_002952244.1 hypothetical protein VOLCADRAFT_81755 [Volvox carteri f. nagariensis]